MAMVVLLVDGVEIRKYPVDGKRLLIGRSRDAQIHIDDATVSGKHAVVESVKSKDLNNAYEYFIQDLGSTNGTHVGGKKIRREKLLHGDVIKIGWNTFKFIGDEGEKTQSAESQNLSA